MQKKSDATQNSSRDFQETKRTKKQRINVGISIEGCLDLKPSVEKKDKKSQHLGLPGVNTKPLKENSNNNFFNQSKCTNMSLGPLYRVPKLYQGRIENNFLTK